ncbi:Serine/threonine-protein kinase-like protein CCR2 [Linum grandiflorum]
MGIRIHLYGSLSLAALFLILTRLPITAFGYGSSGPVAAAFGGDGFFCAIDAGGKQEILCWDKDDTFTASSSSSGYFASLPPMASLSGGEEFLCGITSNTSQAFCFKMSDPGTNLVPTRFRYTSYSKVAAGKKHVCGIRGSYYSVGLEEYSGIDCWEFNQSSSSSFSSSYVDSLLFKNIVAGDGFSCGVVKEKGVICWGPRSGKLDNIPTTTSIDFEILASGKSSVCGISSQTREVQCWGEPSEFGNSSPSSETKFVDITAGGDYYCGIREDNHEVECWGTTVNSSSVQKGSGFLAIASSDSSACGIREVDLVLDCWSVHGKTPPDYRPPLQLCSPGTCSSAESCPDRMFVFNASTLNEPELTNVCARKYLKICLPCGTNCSEGYFPSSVCTENADRICTACSLCQNSSCWDICGKPQISQQMEQKQIKKLAVIIGISVAGFLLLLTGCCLIFQITRSKKKSKNSCSCIFCFSEPVVEADPDQDPDPLPFTSLYIGEAQVFRLTELKDATHGFKEFNELGRGSFGFVYKAVLSDGRHVVVKRANATTIIHTNSREFESELEILCGLRHSNIVNLLGYCAEMGERLMVYEYMPHGTLYDHLHGELSPLDWSLRLKISLQAARGLEYLHKEVTPSVVHHNLQTKKVLLDSGWGARIADFGFSHGNDDKEFEGSKESDVYSFGVILLEILSGRKAYDRECTPPGIVEWALPLIRSGKSAAIIDRNVGLPRNVEPLLKVAEVAEAALKENPSERPDISTLSSMLDEIVRVGLIF